MPLTRGRLVGVGAAVFVDDPGGLDSPELAGGRLVPDEEVVPPDAAVEPSVEGSFVDASTTEVVGPAEVDETPPFELDPLTEFETVELVLASLEQPEVRPTTTTAANKAPRA